MNKKVFRKIEEEFNVCPEAFGGPVPLEEIAQAEEILQVRLPEDYRFFLLKYGSGAIGEAIILGLKEAEFVATPSFVKQSLHFRHILPEGYKKFIAIEVDGAGNPVGFNSPDPEIIAFDFDFGGKEGIAASFEAYVEKALSNELNIYF